ncbi:hypothetical protein C1I98_36060 [Spongiactinospora gelatinilytica]|uniref:Lipopolysaccharide biosynthesis protein n=1 Tax=Spongiactinospora gelatinilytica TaxID=2666298 RepID=A0A2W2EMA5_9ACTN|nr:hypothetical protein [Spongiactinospora gelatinilytica]PZG23841.1 hypothetical protein C1I98_36060 [Spongiactinospora gelatinilytica]
MDFWGTVLVLFRRWYLSVPAFVLAVGAAFGVYKTVPVTHVSSAMLVLTIPTSGGSLPNNPQYPNPKVNPLLNFDHGLSVSASILIAALGTPEVAAELGSTPGGTTYRAFNGSSNLESLATGPFVFIEAESADPAAAKEMVRKVIARAHVELAERQRRLSAPEATYIELSESVPPTTPLEQGTRKMRAVAAALGLGVISALTVTFAGESVAGHRRGRRSRAPVVPPEPGPEPATAGEPGEPGEPGEQGTGLVRVGAPPPGS